MFKSLYAFIVIVLLSSQVAGQVKNSESVNTSDEFPSIALINNVQFTDTSFNNPLAGCGFLIEENESIFAVTCKHALWVAKSDTMKHIHFAGTLKEWRMERKDDAAKFLITDKLVNENRTELIGEENVNADYLVFTIAGNHTDVQPLQIRETELAEGEAVYMVGWSFKDKTGPQRLYKANYFKSQDGHILLKDVEGNPNKAGLSGGAVIDTKGELVGIVSNFTQDSETGEWYPSPCRTDYLKKVLKEFMKK